MDTLVRSKALEDKVDRFVKNHVSKQQELPLN